MITILLALDPASVGFKFRGKIADPRWRALWDWALFIGGFVPALIFGVAVGNVLLGVPFGLDGTLRPSYEGTFFGPAAPFALVSGSSASHCWWPMAPPSIALRTEGPVAERAGAYGRMAAAAGFVLFLLAGFWVAFLLPGYVVTSVQDCLRAVQPTEQDRDAFRRRLDGELCRPSLG